MNRSKKIYVFCCLCRERKELNDMIDVEERAKEMLSIVNDIPYEKRHMFCFIWEELRLRMHHEKKYSLEEKKLICDDCFERTCNDIRQSMGTTKSDFANYMNPTEAVKVLKVKEQSKKLTGPFSSKTISKIKKK